MNLRNNLSVCFRHLKADKANTLISLAGLILGLGIVTVVLVFILNEFSYNYSFANRDRIYRVLNYDKNTNTTWAKTPFIIGETAKNNFAEVENFLHIYNVGDLEVKQNMEFIHEPNMLCTESKFFNMLGVKIIQGNLDDFDETDRKILLSQKLSKKYFGNEDPIGKQINIRCKSKEFPMEVVAVYADIPNNSTIKASLIASIDFGMKNLADALITDGSVPSENEFRQEWNGTFFTNFLLLKKGADEKVLETKLQELGQKNSEENYPLSLSLQPFSDIYFGSEKIVDNFNNNQGNWSMLFLFGIIGLLILIVASINYLNLASAKVMTQLKNIAVRKVCGAGQKSIVGQIILESTLITLIALPFAIMVAKFSLPLVSRMLGKGYTIEMTNQMAISLATLFFISLGTGILAGLLIAAKTSRFNLVDTLKGNKSNNVDKNYARKGLVVFQFSVFIVLIAFTLAVQKQVHYAFNKNLGFEKEGLISVPLGDHNLELFKQEILKNPNVLSASGTIWMPPTNNKIYASIPKVDDPNEKVKMNALFVDYGFAHTMGMKIIMGSDFDREKNNSGVLINELAIKVLGLKDVLGEQTAFGKVVGVVSNFNMFSLREAITPMIIELNPGMSRDIAIRLRTENMPETIDFLKKTWTATGGTTAFNFRFTDDILKNMYESDIRFSRTIGLLAAIAIAIACLGLFGLSLLIGKQRTKEIGIRKINGARISEIMLMLNKDFVKWVAIAFVVATPIAWYVMHLWLENFAYKTSLSWWIFALAGLLALGIALLTVSWQSWRAATCNPVETLRYE